MEICLDAILALNDASDVRHRLVETLSRYQKLDSHISMQWEALLLYKERDRVFFHLNSSTVLRS